MAEQEPERPKPAAYYRYMEEFDRSLEKWMKWSSEQDELQNEGRELGTDPRDNYGDYDEDEDYDYDEDDAGDEDAGDEDEEDTMDISEREAWWAAVRAEDSQRFWKKVLEQENEDAQVEAMRPLLGFLTEEYFGAYLEWESKITENPLILDLVRLGPRLFAR